MSEKRGQKTKIPVSPNSPEQAAEQIYHEKFRKEFLKSMKAEAKLRLNHIHEKKETNINLQKQSRIPYLEEAELLFNMFVFFNWLAHIDLRKEGDVGGEPMRNWLTKITTWPPYISDAFWSCLRNPTMHLGRTSIFTNHNKDSKPVKLYAGLHPDLNFDPMKFQPKNMKPKKTDDGWMAVTGLHSNPNELDVTFYFAGLERKLNGALNEVIEGIETADKTSLEMLYKMNTNTLPSFFVSDST